MTCRHVYRKMETHLPRFRRKMERIARLHVSWPPTSSTSCLQQCPSMLSAILTGQFRSGGRFFNLQRLQVITTVRGGGHPACEFFLVDDCALAARSHEDMYKKKKSKKNHGREDMQDSPSDIFKGNMV